MPFEILEHTGDFEIQVTGKNKEELFADALSAMQRFLKIDYEDVQPTIERKINLSADSPTHLLIDFLSEALLLSETNKEIYTRVEFSKLTKDRLSAILYGAPVDRFDDDIKAVTYHKANLVKNSDGLWETDLVFDI